MHAPRSIAVLLRRQGAWDSPGGLFKHRVLATTQSFRFCRSGVGPRIRILNNVPGAAAAAVLGTTL